MNEIRKTWNAYERHDGYVMNWERDEVDGGGHHVTMMDSDGRNVEFRWRSGIEPQAGARVSVVMVTDGVTTRPERPVLVLDHDSGNVIREQNAPPPRGTRPIMMSLGIWMMAALAVSALIISQTADLMFVVLTLLSAAFLVWRLAIATSEVRMDERAQTRIRDEEKLCLEIMTGEWRLSAGQVIEMNRLTAA